MSSFIAWTQLVSTKHGVSRIGFLGHHCEALASDTAPKQSDISVSSSSISSQHFCNELGLKPPATERALRRITDRPTHIHSLATTAETRAFHLFSFTFSSFFFSISRPYLVSILGMILLCGCFFQKRQKATLAFRSLLLFSFPCFKIAFVYFIFYLEIPGSWRRETHIIRHSSSKRPVRHYPFLHTNRFFLSFFFSPISLSVRYPPHFQTIHFFFWRKCVYLFGASLLVHMGFSPFAWRWSGDRFGGKEKTVRYYLYI